MRCPYDALEVIGASVFCSFHAAVVRGHIADASWTPAKTPLRGVIPVGERLVEEWR